MTKTEVSEFVAVMWKLRLPQTVIIPLSVVFRYFPTIREEWVSIRAAMKIQRTKDRVQKGYLVMQEVNHQLFSDSVREEIVLGNSHSTEDSLKEIMALLDISELAERHPMTLSGGQKQHVIIASAMFCGKKDPVL